MTIQTTSNKTTYVGDGVTVAFPTVFPFTANNEVFVTRVTIADGTRVPLTEGINYTLAGAGNVSGTLTTLGTGSPLSALYQIEMIRVVPLVQLINLVANDQFGAETVERGLDRSMMIDQQLDARLQVIEAGGSSGAALDAANVGGSGVGVYAGKVATTLNFWKLRAGIGMTLTLDSDGIRFDSVGGEAAVVNVGTGTGQVFRDQIGSVFNFKTLKAGTNISLTNGANEITIDAAGSGGGSIAANVGTGAGLVFRDLVGSVFNFRTIKAGANITLTNNANDITIDAAVGSGSLPPTPALPTSKFLRGDSVWTNVLAGQSFLLASPGNPIYMEINRDSAPVNERAWRIGAYDGTNQSFSINPIDDIRSNMGGGITIHRNNAAVGPPYSTRNVSIFPPLQVGAGFAFGASEPATALWVKGLTKHDGNIEVTAGANRLFLADFSTGTPTPANRFTFQTSVVDGDTTVQFKPNGTNKICQFAMYNNSDLTAPASFISIRVDASSTQLRNSTINGGTGLPFLIYSTGNVGLSFDATNNVQIGGVCNISLVSSDMATNATANFLYIPTMNGTPTGVPSAKTGYVPIVYDRAANKLAIYNGGAWKQTAALT